MAAQHIGDLVWYAFMASIGIVLAVTGPKYLHLIDKGFTEKSRKNPDAAAKQVKLFRGFGCAFGLLGLAKIAIIVSR